MERTWRCRSAARRCRSAARPRLPRTRGDGPGSEYERRMMVTASPHTRGWTRFARSESRVPERLHRLLGRDPLRALGVALLLGLPRTRGDGPHPSMQGFMSAAASPHTRGWTPQVEVHSEPPEGFPAHAGMDPHSRPARQHSGRLPRTRGDGPRHSLARLGERKASPHTRGWTRVPARGKSIACGFPAHAGMDPGGPRASRGHPRLPRTRGDGPSRLTITSPRSRASPHTRGWTATTAGPDRRYHGFPAHAGMDLVLWRADGRAGRLPRTRGDGPV